jgi:hypothetical protein
VKSAGALPRPEESAWIALIRAPLLAGVAACCLLGSATAQETLRGAVGEDNINQDLLSRPSLAERRTALAQPEKKEDPAAATGIPAPAYEPETETVDPLAAQSQFDDPQADEDAFGEAAEPTPTRRPSTARLRIEAAREAALEPPSRDDEDAATDVADEEASTGTVRAGTIDSEADLALDPGAEPEPAIEGLEREAEDNPYEAVGIRAGTFILRPSAETGVTYTTNADSSATGDPAVLSESTLRLNAASDWSRHSAILDAYGIFRKSVSGAELQETEAGADAELRLDIGTDLTATGTLGYVRRPESALSPVELPAAVTDRPIRQTLDGSIGLAKEVGKARFGITGAVERDWFSDADLSTGGVLSQEERNSTLATVALRGGYEISPALTPFVELEYGRRFMDLDVDSSGFARSSDRLGARGGVELDLAEKLSGEVSAGWVRESFEDPRLAAISGASVEADLAWSPVRGTTVGLTGSTTVEGTTDAGKSGSILYATRLSVERQLRHNLTGNVALGASLRDYAASSDRDLILNAEGSLTWWLNRYAGVTGRLRHETFESTLPGRDAQTNSVFLGLKLQR